MEGRNLDRYDTDGPAMASLPRHIGCAEGAVHRLRGGGGSQAMSLNRHGAYAFGDGEARTPAPIPMPPRKFFEVCDCTCASHTHR